MTKQEKIIVSAYTGVLMCDLADLYKYIEEKLGYPIWTHQHQLADPSLWDEIKEVSREEFLKLCKEE